MYTCVFLLVISFVAVSNGILQGTVDVNKLQGILQDNLKSKDISSLYHAIRGLKQLNYKLPSLCDDIKNSKYDIKNIEQVYYLTNAASLTGCLNSLKPDVLQTASQVMDKKDATIQDIFYAVYSLKALGKGSVYDKEDALKNLIQLLKNDDSVTNYGYLFQLCEHMGCGAWTMKQAEGVVSHADESDGRALHWEGGLPVTSQLLTVIYRTYKSVKKPMPLTEDQRYKFAEYLLSRRSVTSAKGALLLLEAANALAEDEPSPISIAIKGKKYVTSESDSIEIAITDLIGRAVRGLKPNEVIAQSGTRLADDVVVLSKQPLTQSPKDPTAFVLNLSKIKSQYGLYKIGLSAGTKASSVNVAVLGWMQVASVEIGVGDVDGTTSPKTTVVSYPNKLGEVVQADHLQKVFLKFSVRDKANKPVTVQQAFVRIASVGADDEVIFVAEPDNTKTYKVELNVGTLAKHFNQLSGQYSVSLYLGDSAISNPINWPLGELTFNFDRDFAVGSPVARSASHSGAGKALPEIAHSFRVAEARPPRLVSDVFAAACAAPLLLVLVMWLRLRVNLRLLPVSLAPLLFHASLAGCLGLYGVLWLQLSMFETLRYLLPLAALTFLAGHRLLRTLADKTR